MIIIRTSAFPIALAGILGLATMVGSTMANADTCTPKTVRVFWSLDLEDGPAGDYLLGDEEVPARGVRVTVIPPYPEPAADFFLDEEGVGTFDSQFTAGHRIVVHAEAMIGVGTNAQIHLKVFPEEVLENVEPRDVTALFGTNDDANDPPAPFWVANVVQAGDDISVTIPDADSRLVSMLAATSETIYRVQHELGSDSPLGGAQATRRLAIAMHPDSGNAFANVNGIYLGAPARRAKFVVGHETGHWIQFQTAGQSWDFDYNYGPNTDAPRDDPQALGVPESSYCRFRVEGVLTDTGDTNPNRHGIRSAEYSSGAMPEGFGHFVASVAFNAAAEDGVFRYYKTPDNAIDLDYWAFIAAGGEVSLAGGSSPEPGTLGGQSQWVETQCVEDWNYPITPDIPQRVGWEVTSEIDWLRFFWQFMNSAGESNPTFWDTVRLVTRTQLIYPWAAFANTDDHVLWPHMHQSAIDTLSGPHLTRFEDLTVDNGVYNEP